MHARRGNTAETPAREEAALNFGFHTDRRARAECRLARNVTRRASRAEPVLLDGARAAPARPVDARVSRHLVQEGAGFHATSVRGEGRGGQER